jgi:hypothetical protein
MIPWRRMYSLGLGLLGFVFLDAGVHGRPYVFIAITCLCCLAWIYQTTRSLPTHTGALESVLFMVGTGCVLYHLFYIFRCLCFA